MRAVNLFISLLLVALACITVEARRIQHGGRADSSVNLPYPLVPARINATIGGVHIDKQGTLQEIHAQLLAENPDFKLPNVTVQAPRVSARDGPSNLYCTPISGWDWGMAWSTDINHMQNLMETWIYPAVLAPQTCTLLLEENTGQIFGCNDAPYPQYPTYTYLSTLVTLISQRCTSYDAYWENDIVGGQQFDYGWFNVVVKSNGN